MRKLFRLGVVITISSLIVAGCSENTNGPATTRAISTPANANIAGTMTGSTASREIQFSAFLTGYSYWDNTPPGSSAIARPVIHRRAGGSGTYQDPITIAVGHTIRGSKSTMDFPTGTRFYFKGLRKYAIVEDLCGDGNQPQNGPCHSGYQGNPWLDIYVDGAKSPRSASVQCMNRLTRVHNVVQNPDPDYPVVVGALTESGCQTFSG